MQALTDGLLLYHGSYCEVKKLDLLQCAKYKDFGREFYVTVTSSRKQAAQGMHDMAILIVGKKPCRRS